MPITQDALTQDELDMLKHAVLSEHVANRDQSMALGRSDRPTYNWLMSKAKNPGDPINGGFRFNVKGLRGQEFTFWDGLDVLPFEERYTGMALKFHTGKAHYGNILPYDFLERAGVKISYERGIRQGQLGGMGSAVERVVNILKEQADDILEDLDLQTAKTCLKANADQPKAWLGLDGLVPVTSPSAGSVGGLSRSNRLLRHQVLTGLTADTIQQYLPIFIRNLNRKARGKSVDFIPVGDNVYELLVSVFTGTSTTAGKFDYRAQRDMAMSKGEKLKIGLPQDCFMYENILIVNDPMFAVLHEEEPTAGWASRGYCLNSNYLYPIEVKDEGAITHPMPYNQRVQFSSWHKEMTMVSLCPNAQGVFTTSFGGFGLAGA